MNMIVMLGDDEFDNFNSYSGSSYQGTKAFLSSLNVGYESKLYRLKFDQIKID